MVAQKAFPGTQPTTLIFSPFALDPPRPPGHLVSMPRRSKALTQLHQMQDVAHSTLQTLSNDLNQTQDKALRAKLALGIASLCKAFDTLEDRKRILHGRPMPGSLRPDAEPKKQRRSYRSAPVEIVEFRNDAGKESLPAASPEGDGGQGGMGVAVK